MITRALRQVSLLPILFLTLITGCSSHALAPAPIAPQGSDASQNAQTRPSGLLYVTNYYQGSFRAFHVSDNGNVAPVRVIAGARTTLVNPIGVALARDGRVGIALSGGAIHAQTFAPNAQGNAAPLTAISCGGLDGRIVWGSAFDPAGNLYITSGRHGGYNIAVFAPNDTGCVRNNRIIAGPHTTLNQPYGIAVDATGAIYTANASGASVAVFAPGATGDAAPRAFLSGSNAQLDSPADVAVDAAFHIYVTDFRTNRVVVFAPGANGNVAPTRIIAGGHTGLNGPVGVAVDRSGAIYVSNVNDNTITEYAASARGNATPIRTLAGPKTGIDRPGELAVSP